MLADDRGARREVDELISTIQEMASFIGIHFVPDEKKIASFIAAREQGLASNSSVYGVSQEVNQ